MVLGSGAFERWGHKGGASINESDKEWVTIEFPSPALLSTTEDTRN